MQMVFFKEKDIALDLMGLPTPREYELLSGLMCDLRPNLVGISVRSSFLGIATKITRGIQQELGAPVLWGGTHATVVPEDSVQIADSVCLGEGEEALLELAGRLSRGEAASDVGSVWMREEDRVAKNEIRPLIADLDSIPFPDYENEGKYLIEDDRISCGDPGLQAFNLDIMTSRGCPYHCTYCSNSILRELCCGKGQVVRRRSAQNVLDEIKTQRERFHDVKRIDFIDEVFSWDKQWVEEFVEAYTRDVGLPFHCMQHPNAVDRDIMRMLRGAGLERVEIGIQAGSERVRKQVFERSVSDAKLIEASRVMTGVGISPFYDLIVDNPFETSEDKRRGLDLLLKMSRPFHMHMFSLVYFPKTALTRRALEAKLITEDQVEGRASASFDQFYVSLRHPRSPEDQFWISLYSLTSKWFVPKRLIRLLSRSGFLRVHPKPLIWFADLCNSIKLGGIAVKWLVEGKPVLRSLRSGKKSGKQGRRIV